MFYMNILTNISDKKNIYTAVKDTFTHIRPVNSSNKFFI